MSPSSAPKAPLRTARLRRLRPSDGPAVARLIEKVLREHGLWKGHRKSLKDPRLGCSDFFVVEAAGRVAGCGGLRPVSRSAGELGRMYLERRLRGRGLGRAMVGRIEAAARRRGLKKLFLESSTRFERAVRLYARCGFKGRILDTDNCCNVYMEKRLDRAGPPRRPAA